jgi:hypothetical protein
LHLQRSWCLRPCLLWSWRLRSCLLRSRTDVFTVFSSSVADVEYFSPSRRRFGIRISVYAFASAVPTGGLHGAAIYAASNGIALSPPISTSPSIVMPPNVVNARFLRLSHLLPSTVSFDDGNLTVGAQSKYTQTIKLGNLLGWDGVGDWQKQMGWWNNQQNDFVLWDCRNLTINQKIKNMIKNIVSPLFIFFCLSFVIFYITNSI